jgi:hypothetical protein
MDFTIDCACGQKLCVGTADAGGSKRCHCGAINAVPSLSELRRRGGQQGYEVSIADKLRYMFAEGELPPDNACVQCGAETSSGAAVFSRMRTSPYERSRVLGDRFAWSLRTSMDSRGVESRVQES